MRPLPGPPPKRKKKEKEQSIDGQPHLGFKYYNDDDNNVVF